MGEPMVIDVDAMNMPETKKCLKQKRAPLVVSNVHVRKVSPNTYSREGEYFGGYEGESLYSWYRESDDEKIVLTTGADCKTYEVADADYGCRLLFGWKLSGVYVTAASEWLLLRNGCCFGMASGQMLITVKSCWRCCKLVM